MEPAPRGPAARVGTRERGAVPVLAEAADPVAAELGDGHPVQLGPSTGGGDDGVVDGERADVEHRGRPLDPQLVVERPPPLDVHGDVFERAGPVLDLHREPGCGPDAGRHGRADVVGEQVGDDAAVPDERGPDAAHHEIETLGHRVMVGAHRTVGIIRRG
jgi:hypothetical protein